MNIISLNTWGGRAGKEKLLAFFKTHADTTDAFCLQEMWRHAYKDLNGKTAGGVALDYSKIMDHGVQEVSALLPDFTAFFRPHLRDNYGLLTLIKKKYPVQNEGEVFVYREKGHVANGDVGNHDRNIQYTTIETDTGPLTIINFHGLWNGQGKGDSADRLAQSEKILAFALGLPNPYILCGDFNLLLHTESIKKFEDVGLRNLIREFGITSTRTSFYTKPEKHADYAFVSAGITVADFKVLPDEVSDHAPLFINCTVAVV